MMRALLMAGVLAIGTPAMAEPPRLYVRAAPAPVETAAPRASVREPSAARTDLATRRTLPRTMQERDEAQLPIHEKQPARASLMEQLRERILDELPVVSSAVVAPLPISSADGTLAGVGVLGKF